MKFVLIAISMTDLFESLKSKNAFSEGTFNKLRPVGSKLGTFYGQGKMHQSLKNRLSPFRSSISTIDTPGYKLGKCLNSILPGITGP